MTEDDYGIADFRKVKLAPGVSYKPFDMRYEVSVKDNDGATVTYVERYNTEANRLVAKRRANQISRGDLTEDLEYLPVKKARSVLNR